MKLLKKVKRIISRKCPPAPAPAPPKPQLLSEKEFFGYDEPVEGGLFFWVVSSKSIKVVEVNVSSFLNSGSDITVNLKYGPLNQLKELGECVITADSLPTVSIALNQSIPKGSPILVEVSGGPYISMLGLWISIIGFLN